MRVSVAHRATLQGWCAASSFERVIIRVAEEIQMLCECGCGETAVAGLFKPGHDQKLRTVLEHCVGGLLALRALVEAAEAFAAGQSHSDVLTQKVRAIFEQGRKNADVH
jgi:hypothetical protein